MLCGVCIVVCVRVCVSGLEGEDKVLFLKLH